MPQVNIIVKVIWRKSGGKTGLSLVLSDVGFNGTGVLRGCRHDLTVLVP